MLHAGLVLAVWLVSAWSPAPTLPDPDPVVPVTFAPIAEFRPEPAPPPAPPPPSSPVVRASAAVPSSLTPPPPTSRSDDSVRPDERRIAEAAATAARRDPDRPDAPRPATDPPGGGEGRPGGFDVGRALSEFGRARRAPDPGEGDDGGGRGSGVGPGEGPGSGLVAPDLEGLPGTGFGFGNLEFETRDFDWRDYARQLYVAIWRAWHNRLYLSTDAFEKWSFQQRVPLLEHQNRIRFTIDRSGEVVGIALEAASGCVPLDDSALDALHEVVLPPLPSDFPKRAETVRARFLASGEIRAMRGNLEYLRSRGYF